ncbi:hypothetical protein Tco_1153887 [Tanacetum coccineum]
MVKPIWNNAESVNHQNFAKKTHPYDKKNLVPRAVLMKSGLVSINTTRQNISKTAVLVNIARQVNAAHSKRTVNVARPMSYLSKTEHSTIDGGYVAFGWDPKGGKITGTSTIKTVNLDFENVYFVRELKFNLFSISQMCDKMNSVLFNDIECIVLSLNFKLIDESQVLLRVPRKNNMYSIDLKNIVAKGVLTCLFAKATSDESKLWHRRLGRGKTKKFQARPKSQDLHRHSKFRKILGCKLTSIKWVNAVGGKTSIELPFDPNMPALKDYSIFDFSRDDEDDGAVVDMNNLDTIIQVSPILTTRIHKDHPLNQVIGDLQSATQTRKMSKNLEEHGFEEPKKVIHALKDPSWIEAMHEELLQFKLQRSMIGSLMYLTSSRSDIMFTVCACARYQVNPKVLHLHVVKTIFSARKRQWLKIPQQNLSMWLLQVAMDKCFGFRINYLIMGKAKKSVRLMMEKFFGMELELMLVTQNANPIKHALTVNPTIYTSCIEHFWATVKVKTVNGKVQLHALVDGKKIIINESTVRRDLQLEDAEGRPSHKRIYDAPSHSKKIFGNMKRVGKSFSGRVTPLFPTMVVQNQQELGEGLTIPTDPHHTPTIIESSTQPQNTQKPRKPKRKDTQVPQPSGPTDIVVDEAVHKELGESLVRAATTASSLEAEQNSGGGPKRQETIGDTIAQTSLKRRVKKLDQKKWSRTHGLKRLHKVSMSRRVESSGDEDSLGEDASKQGRMINAIDADEDITLVNVQANAEMFDVSTLTGDEVFAEQEVAAKSVNLIVDEVY